MKYYEVRNDQLGYSEYVAEDSDISHPDTVFISKCYIDSKFENVKTFRFYNHSDAVAIKNSVQNTENVHLQKQSKNMKI